MGAPPLVVGRRDHVARGSWCLGCAVEMRGLRGSDLPGDGTGVASGPERPADTHRDPLQQRHPRKSPAHAAFHTGGSGDFALASSCKHLNLPSRP